MCVTSSALIQEVTAAGREGSPDTTGLQQKEAARSQQEEEQEADTRALKWQRFIFMRMSHSITCAVAGEIIECFQVCQPHLLAAMLALYAQFSETSSRQSEISGAGASTDLSFTNTTER